MIDYPVSDGVLAYRHFLPNVQGTSSELNSESKAKHDVMIQQNFEGVTVRG